jgi:hypothetical protein
MIAVGLLFVRMLCDFFKPRPRLEAEILILRHQLNVLQQRMPRRRLHLRWVDRALFIAKAGPQHRKSKSKTKSSKNPERKKKAPPKRG